MRLASVRSPVCPWVCLSTCSEIIAAGVLPEISVPPPRPPSPPANPAMVFASAALFTATTAVDDPATLPVAVELSSPMPESSGLAFVELSSPPSTGSASRLQFGTNQDGSRNVTFSMQRLFSKITSISEHFLKRWRTFDAVSPAAAPDPLLPLREPRDRPPPRRGRPGPGRPEVRLGAYGRVGPRHRHVRRLGALEWDRGALFEANSYLLLSFFVTFHKPN